MVPTEAKYLAVGHRGSQYWLRSETPRKELMALADVKSAEKVYRDGPNGEAQHIGYIVDREWFTLYAIEGIGPRKS
jgi:hypothetical protein